MSLLILAVVSGFMWMVSDPPAQYFMCDFTQAYYPAGRAIVENLSHLYERVSACKDTAICGFVNIPIVALLFTPLSFLTLHKAHLLFLSASLLGVAMTMYLLCLISRGSASKAWSISALFVINGPLFYSLKEGNLTHFVLLILVVAVVCIDKDREVWVGACFAIAAVIKLPLLLIGAYFLVRRRWSAAAGFGLMLVVAAVSLMYAGWGSHVAWYREAVLPFSDKGLSAFNVQSLDGFVLRLQDDTRLYDWRPAEVEWSVKIMRYALAGALLGISVLVFRREQGRDRLQTTYLELSMVVCIALIISPISWTHYYLLLLLPLSLYIGDRLPVAVGGLWLGGIAVCTLLISPPVTFIQPDNSFIGQMTSKLFLSHYLLGAFTLWAILGYARWRVGQCCSSQMALMCRSSDSLAA